MDSFVCRAGVGTLSAVEGLVTIVNVPRMPVILAEHEPFSREKLRLLPVLIWAGLLALPFCSCGTRTLMGILILPPFSELASLVWREVAHLARLELGPGYRQTRNGLGLAS